MMQNRPLCYLLIENRLQTIQLEEILQKTVDFILNLRKMRPCYAN
ncbi:hypothetical protein F542_2070 [Bibersteinia trehalosi USDA-ARS-USMARC-188]|uniref:Uncharacterized protein n=3 Tax=Bibersteinia trehalosi TaxID=47735 RepID=W0R911_BIBTR|nr:hypothetical protein [Bibersteinia trehalosi]AGH39329.1 hypothetical protein WQG_20520 [Bibersteinia trehalosi USDA-ARS-USMARC-192]AHG80925.1 hypothetical protein F542_2070 [Bibersteinia trehalosi USDA-ARS-USMARC-188]AHG83137.1 hypothetical protein F543_2730 [Bibersteinia trehalosi USDA-ARS-USMARC-189]AHG87261.1 hypothetical protein F544_20330 [Bibersteinia trehalosi USDA-ARS-USMARC-190]